ncbi:MAG: sulfite exporter TauE/SafE family protein [Pseudomonadota bacterium]
MSALPPISELYPFLAALLIAGGLAGVLAGLFGIGGGAVLVPVFYQIIGILGVDEAVRMHICVATSLAIIVPTSIRSFLSHLDKGVVDMDLLKSFWFSVPLAVLMASVVAAYLSSEVLRGIFVVFSLVIAFKLLFGKESWRLASDLPKGMYRFACGWFIGFFSTFMGIGGGVFNNTFMTLFGRPIHQAVATSAGVGVLISIPGVIGYIWAGWGLEALPPYSLGFVNLLIVAIIIPVTFFTAPIGVRLAHRLEKRQLEVCFGIFLLVVAIRFLISLGM